MIDEINPVSIENDMSKGDKAATSPDPNTASPNSICSTSPTYFALKDNPIKNNQIIRFIIRTISSLPDLSRVMSIDVGFSDILNQ